MGVFIQFISIAIATIIIFVTMYKYYLKGRKDVLTNLLNDKVIDYETFKKYNKDARF